MSVRCLGSVPLPTSLSLSLSLSLIHFMLFYLYDFLFTNGCADFVALSECFVIRITLCVCVCVCVCVCLSMGLVQPNPCNPPYRPVNTLIRCPTNPMSLNTLRKLHAVIDIYTDDSIDVCGTHDFCCNRFTTDALNLPANLFCRNTSCIVHT